LVFGFLAKPGFYMANPSVFEFSSASSDSCTFDRLWKTHSCMFFLQICTRNWYYYYRNCAFTIQTAHVVVVVVVVVAAAAVVVAVVAVVIVELTKIEKSTRHCCVDGNILHNTFQMVIWSDFFLFSLCVGHLLSTFQIVFAPTWPLISSCFEECLR
jgi:hypothetical protein